MVNTASPFGFRQFGQREGTAPTAGFERLLIASSDTNLYFTGDVVCQSSGTSSPLGTITVISSATGLVALSNSVAGVFLGCEYYSPTVARQVWSNYFPGNLGTSATFANAYVCTNPEQLYIAQASSGAVMGTTCIGLGCFPSLTGSSLGNTTTGQSVQSITSSQVTSLSSNAVFRIVDIYQNYAPPGVNGTSSGAEALQIMVVQPNNWTRRQTVLQAS
jgi:hypothetical protein